MPKQISVQVIEAWLDSSTWKVHVRQRDPSTNGIFHLFVRVITRPGTRKGQTLVGFTEHSVHSVPLVHHLDTLFTLSTLFGYCTHWFAGD